MTKRKKPKNIFASIEKGQATAHCVSCGTSWKTIKKSITRCPFCGHHKIIVLPFK